MNIHEKWLEQVFEAVQVEDSGISPQEREAIESQCLELLKSKHGHYGEGPEAEGDAMREAYVETFLAGIRYAIDMLQASDEPRFEVSEGGEDEAGSPPMVVYVPLRLTLADIEEMVHTRLTGRLP